MFENKEKFPSMESEVNYPVTSFAALLVWITVILLLGSATFPIHELIHYGFEDYMVNKTGQFVGLIMMIIFCLSGGLFIALYFIRAKKNNKYTVVVNNTGAFIYYPNGKISQEFLYSDLCPSENSFYGDIVMDLNIKRNTTKLIIYEKKVNNTCDKKFLSFQWEYNYLKNRFELYQHFLKGVQIFRPDLKIQYNTLLHFQLIEK